MLPRVGPHSLGNSRVCVLSSLMNDHRGALGIESMFNCTVELGHVAELESLHH